MGLVHPTGWFELTFSNLYVVDNETIEQSNSQKKFHHS